MTYKHISKHNTNNRNRPIGRVLTVYTTGEIARYFGVSQSTVWLWVKKGVIPTWHKSSAEHAWNFIDMESLDALENKFRGIVANDPNFMEKYRKIIPNLLLKMEGKSEENIPDEGDMEAACNE